MTERHAGYIVTLDSDLREDDAEALKLALTSLRGVISVEPVVADASLHIAEERARTNLTTQMWDILYPKKGS